MSLADLHVFDAGTGDPVVLLHGMSPIADLEALVDEFPGHRILVPHLPGYGSTPHAPGRQGVDAMEPALIEALSRRGIERPILVGYSMGANRALSMAAAVRARAVVCLAGFCDLSAEERASFRDFAEALRAGTDLRAVLPGRFLGARHRAAHPADDRVVEAWADVAPSEVLIEELQAIAAAPPLQARIALLDCPIVARTGEVDAAVGPSHARAIVEVARHGTLEIVPDVGHALLLEDREGTVASIRRACASA